MNEIVVRSQNGHRPRRHFPTLVLLASLLVGLVGPVSWPATQAQGSSDPVQFDEGIDAAKWYKDHEIEQAWTPDYIGLATGDPSLLSPHGVYAWPFALDSIGWNIQSYQNYGGLPYFHHGLDMMKVNGTAVFNRSGGQVINVENYQPGNDLYWEVAILDPDGYIWQYHHIDHGTIPQNIWTKFAEYQADPVNGGFIAPDTHLGNIVYWPVMSFGKRFNHIHLNILAAGGVYVNGMEFHTPLPDSVGPQIQDIGLLQNGTIYPPDEIEGSYSLYVEARDLVLDNVYYLPPYEITFAMDGGPEHTTWRFDALPGGADPYIYLNDFYVSPTCGDYYCRDFYIDLGFIPDSQFEFPCACGEHTVLVTVSDYAGNSTSQSYAYSVIGPPLGTVVWQDSFETDRGWIQNPDGTDTATLGWWERGDPEATDLNGLKQWGRTVSGANALVTGPMAGNSANSYDVDGGVTSIRSPDIAIPATGGLTLSFWYYLAHGDDSSAADYIKLTVVGSSAATVLEQLGWTADVDAVWTLETVSLDEFAGQTVYLLLEAADADADSLVEAAMDDVVIAACAGNVAPTANPQSVSTVEDTALGIVLDGSDPNGDSLSYNVVLNPSHGVLSGTAPNLTYTPTANYNGPDELVFVVNDGHVDSGPAMVSIEVTPANDAPTATPQSVSTAEDTSLDIVLGGSDPDGDPLTYSVVSSPTHGTLSGIAPNLTYTPTANYNGPDALTFVANDGQVDSEPATVDIEVMPANDVPVANPQSVTTWRPRPVAITLTGSDVDGDDLLYRVVSQPDHGTLGGIAPNLVYTPTLGYAGPDGFAFVVSDGELDSPPAAVGIKIMPAVYLPMVIR